jgi:hypothetical protein
MEIRNRARTLGAAAALALPLIAASPAAASGDPVAVPKSIITYNVPNNCNQYPSSCYSDGTMGEYFLELDYHSIGYQSSAIAKFHGNVYDYDGDGTSPRYHYIFWAGDGAGSPVKNNAAAVYNSYGQDDYRVYYYSGYTGHSQLIPANILGKDDPVNLDSTLKNENASQHFA